MNINISYEKTWSRFKKWGVIIVSENQARNFFDLMKSEGYKFRTAYTPFKRKERPGRIAILGEKI